MINEENDEGRKMMRVKDEIRKMIKEELNMKEKNEERKMMTEE